MKTKKPKSTNTQDHKPTIDKEVEKNNAETYPKDKVSSEESEKDQKDENIITEVNLDYKDKFVRLYSEYENYRKRTAKEKIDIITNASENLLKDIIPVIDDFERAITNNKNVKDASTIKEGFELIYNKLYKTLTNTGLKPMNAQGETFDADIHEAITKIPAPSKKMKGKVIDVVEKGYMINDKVIRFAKVVIGE
jgi:molecular chaperone GrpE